MKKVSGTDGVSSHASTHGGVLAFAFSTTVIPVPMIFCTLPILTSHAVRISLISFISQRWAAHADGQPMAQSFVRHCAMVLQFLKIVHQSASISASLFSVKPSSNLNFVLFGSVLSSLQMCSWSGQSNARSSKGIAFGIKASLKASKSGHPESLSYKSTSETSVFPLRSSSNGPLPFRFAEPSAPASIRALPPILAARL